MKHYINLLAQAGKIYRHNRQGSYKTRKRYYEAYKRFLHFLADGFRLQKLANISEKHMSAYIEHMHSKGYSSSTIKTDLAAIRFWHDQIPNARYTLPTNSEYALERRRFTDAERAWSNAEFNLMIAECIKMNRLEYEACIAIARYAGLRLHEVFRIDTAIAKAALKYGYITIKGKGGKVRDVPINTTIRIVLEKMLSITPVGQKLFVPKHKPTHLAMQDLQKFIAKYRPTVQDIGSQRPLTFHGLRHLCARDWYNTLLAQGKTQEQAMLQVSRWLGHERGEITKIYLAGT